MLDTKNMTPIEKIRAMEELWASLNEGEAPPETPHWHGRVLRERRQRYEAGETATTDLESLKARGPK